MIQTKQRSHINKEIWQDLPDLPDYREDPEFLLYAQRVDMIIAASGEIGVTTREIHSKLGERARREWTMDAIDSLHMIDQVGFLPTRYRKIGFFKRTRDPHPMIREERVRSPHVSKGAAEPETISQPEVPVKTAA